MITIGLSMIAYNEERSIRKAIESARKVCADPIVAIDNRTTDRTAEEVLAAGGMYCYYGWEDDFSMARNRSLNACLADWILTLDADEWLDCDPEAFRKEVEAIPEDINLAMIPVRYDGSPWSFPSARLVRRFKGRWVGRCHEYLTAPGERYEITTATVIHEKHDRPDLNGERNRRLLEIGLEEEPGNSRYMFYLAREYKDIGEYDAAILLFKKYLEIADWQPEIYRALIDLCDCLIEKSSLDEARHYASRAINLYPHAKEGYYILGEIAKRKDDFGQMAYWALVALDQKPGATRVLFEHDDPFPAWDLLSIACYYLEDMNTGRNAAEQALLLRPDDPRVKMNAGFYGVK